jgi:CRISPR-associated protein (TIGR03986 family)
MPNTNPSWYNRDNRSRQRQQGHRYDQQQGNNRPYQGHCKGGGGGRSSTCPSLIPSPYNFVPLSNTVVFPEWHADVYHDVPLADGLSGELEINIEAISEIYVRNGGSSKDDFFAAATGPNGLEECYIPGTSLKGVLRNVLEIVSFGKMSRVSPHRYALRDLHNAAYTGKMTEKKDIIYPLPKAGWLQEVDGKWMLIPCKHARVEQADIDPKLGTWRGSAVEKYDKFNIGMITFDLDSRTTHRHSCGEIAYKKAVNIVNGKYKGTVVYTGQPSPREYGKTKRKHMEFIFFDHEESNTVNVSALMKDFEFIHSLDRGEPNEEWGYWLSKKRRDPKTRIPVFYLTKNHQPAQPTNPPLSMGLAMMYRLPYTYDLHQTIAHTSPNHLDQQRSDLAELLFGHVHEKGALRGRVQIGHARETADSRHKRDGKTLRLVTTVLGSPKPTFYPNYVKQNQQQGKCNAYKTYMDKEAEVRGWKRYPVRNDQEQLKPDCPKSPTPDVATAFRPLPPGTRFKGMIRFHNLSPIELGALLWVLEWGGDASCRHQVGMAKPLGFGRVRIVASEPSFRYGVSPSPDKKTLRSRFEAYMEAHIPDWRNSDSLKHLLAMASATVGSPHPLTYPVLDPKTRTNHFADHKEAKHALLPYCSQEKKDGTI